jgi:hypothetical protein
MPLVPLAPIARAPVIGNVTPVQLTSNANRTAQIGQAIGQAGETLVGLQAKYAEFVDARSMIAAENVMRQTTNDFNAWRLDPQNADEGAWLPKWQEMQAAAQKQIDGLKMTEGARLNTTRSWGRWSDAQTISVQGDVFKQGVQRAKDAIDLRVMQATKEGDDERIRSSYQHAATLGVMTPERAALEEYEALQKSKQVRVSRFNESLDTMMSGPTVDWKAVRESVSGNADLSAEEKKNLMARIESTNLVRAQKDEVQALTLTNPAEARRKLEAGEFDQLSPGDRQALIVQTKQVQSAGASEAFRDIKTRIALGQVGKNEAFEGPGEMQDLTPLMRDILKAENAAHHDDKAKATRIALQNSPAIYESAVGVISKYDPAEDEGGLRRAEIGAALEANFSGPYLEELNKRLDERGQKPPGEIDAAPALALIQEWTEGGGLGEFKKPLMQDGAAVMTEPKKIGVTAKTPRSFLGIDYLWPDAGGEEVKSTPKPVTEVDPVAQAKAAAKQAAVRKALEAEVKAGKFKTNDEVLNRAVELFQQHGGKAPAITPPATTGASLLLPPPPSSADLEKAMRILNFKPAK